MAVTATKDVVLRGNNFILGLATLVFTGSYAALGDPLDFGAVFGMLTTKQPKRALIHGKAGFIYTYDLVNKKVMVFCNTAGGANLPLVEHTAIAYVAGVTGDVVEAWVLFA